MTRAYRQDERWLFAHENTIRALVPTGHHVLELGCGARARDTVHLATMADVVAVDLSWQALRQATRAVPAAAFLCMDIRQPFPFANGSFPVIVASLSLHYFAWKTSQSVVAELQRCLAPGGLALVRLNSTNDTNYGAGSADSIEQNYHRVDGQLKRFFDRSSIEALFCGWRLESLVEMDIDRYDEVKRIWSFVARPRDSEGASRESDTRARSWASE